MYIQENIEIVKNNIENLNCITVRNLGEEDHYVLVAKMTDGLIILDSDVFDEESLYKPPFLNKLIQLLQEHFDSISNIATFTSPTREYVCKAANAKNITEFRLTYDASDLQKAQCSFQACKAQVSAVFKNGDCEPVDKPMNYNDAVEKKNGLNTWLKEINKDLANNIVL